MSVAQFALALAVFAGLLAVAAPVDDLPPPLAEALQAARHDAEQAATQAEKDNARADAWGKLGMVYHGQRLRELAEQAYDRALGFSESSRWRYLRAIVLSERGDIASAAEDFALVVRAAPANAVARFRLGVARFLLGDLDAASAQLHHAKQAMPDSALVLATQADIALARGRPEQALELLREAWELEPQAGQLAYKLAMTQRRLGNLEAARHWLARQPDNSLAPSIDDPLLLEVAQTSRSPRFLEAAANWALARGDKEQAANALAEAAALSPNDPALALRLANLLGSLGRTQDALLHTRRVLALDDQNAAAWHLLAWLTRNAISPEERTAAAAAAARSLALAEDSKVRTLAAMLAMRDANWSLAAGHYHRLASDHPDNADHRYWLAFALLADANCDGRQPLVDALRLRPDWGEAHLALARADALCDNAEAALRRAERLLAAKNDTETRITRAFAAYGLGRFDETARLANAELPHPDAQALLDAIKGPEGKAALRIFADDAHEWLPSEVRPTEPSVDATPSPDQPAKR